MLSPLNKETKKIIQETKIKKNLKKSKNLASIPTAAGMIKFLFLVCGVDQTCDDAVAFLHWPWSAFIRWSYLP